MTATLEYIGLTIVFVIFWLFIIWGMFFFYQYILKTLFIKLFHRKKVKEVREILEKNITEDEKANILKDVSITVINEASKGVKMIKGGNNGNNIQQETRTEPTTESGGNPAKDKPRDSTTPRHRDLSTKTFGHRRT
jgi:hypothetical protein